MIPNELKTLNRWVCTNADKIPMKPFIRERASSTNPKSWGTYEQAKRCVERGIYENLGFVFANDGYIGIDIDCGFDDTGNISDVARDIISHCDSYTELSKSGRGFHILLKGDIPFNGKNNRDGVEIYKTGRYFVMTGKVVEDKAIIVNNQDAIDYVVAEYFKPQQVVKKINRGEKIYSPNWEKDTRRDKKIALRPTYPPITEGSRNISLLSLAGALLDVGFNADGIYTELLICNERACKPPLGDNEIQNIVRSVLKYKR